LGIVYLHTKEMRNNNIDPYKMLREHNLGTIHDITEAGGTARRTWKIAASSGDYFLRLRGVRTSTVEKPLLWLDMNWMRLKDQIR